MAVVTKETKISKNARTGGSKTQHFFCPCGGELHMVAVAQSFRLKMKSRCGTCGREERNHKAFQA